MSTQTDSPLTQHFATSNRAKRSALLISVLLHIALLVAVSSLGDFGPAPFTEPGVVRITVSPTPVGTGDSPPQPAPETRPDEAEAGPHSEESAVETADESAAPENVAPDMIEPQSSEPETVVAIETSSDPVPKIPDPAPVEPVETNRAESIEESESERLARRVEQWARDFTDPTERQDETVWKNRGNEYTATVERFSADSTGIERALVTVTSERDGKKLTTQMQMQRLGFSHFAHFIDHWDPNVQMHDDVIDGRFHSNTEVFIGRSRGVQPQFTGKVTAARGINTSNSRQGVRRSEVFLGGLDTRAPRIALPRQIALFNAEVDPERVQHFETDTRIIFAADGSFSWSTIENTRRRRSRDVEATIVSGNGNVSNEPHYFIAADDAALHVRGTVNGQILVYSPERVVIEGNLLYHNDPRVDPDSDDYLGLVSDRFVEVADPDVTGRGDLHVHAAIYARSRFTIRSYGKRDDATLYVYGSVTAGSLSATEPRYSTQLNFDPRLADARPPRFPVTDRYEITGWDRSWSVLED